MNAARAALDAAITEREFSDWLRQFAELHGWLCYHTYDSRRSREGFPDWVLVRGDGQIIFAELKSEKGQPTAEQQEWCETIAAADAPEVYLWRPSDADEIERILE